MTILFNTFVFYGLFNQINCRILDDSYNIFQNLRGNCLFIFIILLEISIQICIVQYGGLIFNCVKGGLTQRQWLFCIIISSLTFLISILLKCFNCIGDSKSLGFFFKKKINNDDSNQLVEMVPEY